MHTNTSGSAQAQAELRIGSQTTERFGQTVHGRPRRIRRHSDAGLIRNLKGRRPEVEADDRPPRRHRVEAGLSACIPQRRMNQDMALPERVDHLGARNSTGKVDPVGDPCPPREPLQPPALRAVADHPIFGVGEGRPGEGGETERETAAGPQRADADEPDRRAGRLRQACKRIARFGREPQAAAKFDPRGAERPHPRRSILGGREDDRAPPRGQPHQRVMGGDPAPERAQPRRHPTGSVEARAEARPRRFVTVHRAPYVRHRQQGEQARGRPIGRTDLVSEIEPDLGVQTARSEIGAQVPEIGARRPAGVLRRPPAQAMNIAELRPREGTAAGCGLDRGPIAGVGQNPHLMMPGDLLNHVPADCGAGALIGLARGHRQQNLHRDGLPPVSARGGYPPVSSAPPAATGIDRVCGRSPSAADRPQPLCRL